MVRLILFILLLSCSKLMGQIMSPNDFLSTKYRYSFTPHHLVVDYIEYAAASDNRIQLTEYGLTNEGRPLKICTISSKKNLENLKEIQAAHINAVNGKGEEENQVIIWLSFGVHGNEAGASESALNVIYQLQNNQNPDVDVWLDKAIVLIDPSLNPDGYDRYTHWARSVSGSTPHAGLHDREHMEPWPTGRVNHYYFDLNRDWAWQTQVETQSRMAIYKSWMPHVHVDFHEMGYDDGYYFAPAAEPYHECISPFQRSMQVEFGKNNASYFDQKGWRYFTREVFDLFYPSYGDTYPMFNGAIGMTYEQAGHGMAGRAIKLSNGDTLTIEDRINHHTTAALSTIETACDHKKSLIEAQINYFDLARNLDGSTFKKYILKHGPKTKDLLSLLVKNGISFTRASKEMRLNGYGYFEHGDVTFNVNKGDLIVPADQTMGHLLKVLMEPEPKLVDSLTYDITAWSLPFAYGVSAYGLYKNIDIKSADDTTMDNPDLAAVENGVGYVIPWQSIQSVKVLSSLHQKKINVRLSHQTSEYPNGTIEKGSLVVLRSDNVHCDDLDPLVKKICDGHDFWTLSTGFSMNGIDVGGGKFQLLQKPKVLLLSGSKTNQYAVGQIWHYFEKVIDYPISMVEIDKMDRVDLESFNLIILPDGYFSLSTSLMTKFSSFLSKGGHAIAMSGALNNFMDAEGFALSRYATDAERDSVSQYKKRQVLNARKDSYEDRERRNIAKGTPGAIIKNQLDHSHPMCYGLGENYYGLKTSSMTFSHLKNTWNPIYVPEEFEYYGFIGHQFKKQLSGTSTVAVEEKGSGKLIYLSDNPLFRGFWYNGQILFSNAVFLVQ